jgi:hypothetical protein
VPSNSAGTLTGKAAPNTAPQRTQTKPAATQAKASGNSDVCKQTTLRSNRKQTKPTEAATSAIKAGVSATRRVTRQAAIAEKAAQQMSSHQRIASASVSVFQRPTSTAAHTPEQTGTKRERTLNSNESTHSNEHKYREGMFSNHIRTRGQSLTDVVSPVVKLNMPHKEAATTTQPRKNQDSPCRQGSPPYASEAGNYEPDQPHGDTRATDMSAEEGYASASSF